MTSDSVVSLPAPCMDRMDAARTLLGVSPNLTSSTAEESPVPTLSLGASAVSSSSSGPSRGGGLDALVAALASKEVGKESHNAVRSVSSDDDSEAMPPPPPRRGRIRSVSNPEGMEKWDSMSPHRQERRQYVLPSSILEEELAEAKEAAEAAKLEQDVHMDDMYHQSSTLPFKKRSSVDEPFGTSPNSVTSPISSMAADEVESPQAEESSSSSDESDLEPDELLQRARSRLLEDLSEGSLNGEKGVLTLPHSLSKYKEVYNKNGRIGIYTPAERAAIIARFNGKRSRRTWKKKIRYSCRKNLADRRLRVKGRFVKRTPTIPDDRPMDMPDVTDPEAGFAPTEDQPYRRVRRHTIT